MLEKIVASGRARYVSIICLSQTFVFKCLFYTFVSSIYVSWPPGILGSLLFPWKNSTRSFSLDLLYWSDRMPHFDRNLASYCFLGVGCHKDKSGHNSYVRQEHPGQLELAGEHRPKTVRKPSEGIVKVNFLSRTIFPIFSPRNLGWSMLLQQVWSITSQKIVIVSFVNYIYIQLLCSIEFDFTQAWDSWPMLDLSHGIQVIEFSNQ